jgi:chromosome segregation ATPase
MAPRPTSPTSLLWAHQLKLEHSHLLGRIKALEASSTTIECNVKTVGARNAEIQAHLARLEDVPDRLSAVEKGKDDVLKRLKKMESDGEKTKLNENARLGTLTRTIGEVEAQGKKTLDRHDTLEGLYSALCSRIDQLERRVQSSADNRLIRKNDPQDVKVLSRRLDAIEARRTEDCARTKTLLDRITQLEKTNRDLERENGRFEKEVSRLSNIIGSMQLAERTPSETTTVDISLRGSPHCQTTHSPVEHHGQRK